MQAGGRNPNGSTSSKFSAKRAWTLAAGGAPDRDAVIHARLIHAWLIRLHNAASARCGEAHACIVGEAQLLFVSEWVHAALLLNRARPAHPNSSKPQPYEICVQSKTKDDAQGVRHRLCSTCSDGLRGFQA